MKYLIKTNPSHCRNLDGSQLVGEIPTVREGRTYIHRTEIPHFLNTNPKLGRVAPGVVSMIVPCDMPLEREDVISNEYGFEGMVIDIQERRAARGTWPEPRPHFVKVKYL